MAQEVVTCERCGRQRTQKWMVLENCIHGYYWICSAYKTCKIIAKKNRRAARQNP